MRSSWTDSGHLCSHLCIGVTVCWGQCRSLSLSWNNAPHLHYFLLCLRAVDTKEIKLGQNSGDPEILKRLGVGGGRNTMYQPCCYLSQMHNDCTRFIPERASYWKIGGKGGSDVCPTPPSFESATRLQYYNSKRKTVNYLKILTILLTIFNHNSLQSPWAH